MNMKSANVKSSPKLLIVDDDEGIRNQLKWGLESYDVITADSRLKALALFDMHRPSVVTLDLGLPPDAGGTAEGFTALKEILSKAPETKVVIISGSQEVGASKKAKTIGAFEYYSKPVELQQLQQVIQRAFQNHLANID